MTQQPTHAADTATLFGNPAVRDTIIGIAIGFLLSASFYVIWGAFQLLGFFLWSIAGGGGGALAGGALIGRYLGGRLIWAIAGAIVVRVAIFVFFGGVLL